MNRANRNRMDPGRLKRFWAKVVKAESGCWLWTGATVGRNYGLFWAFGKNQRAHRISYEHFVGRIPDNLTIDHLCNVTSCVNPKHLRPATIRDNILRGHGASAVNSRKTHCSRGHLFNDANTYFGVENGWNRRQCRVCKRMSDGRYRSRKRALSPLSRRHCPNSGGGSL